MVFHKARYDFTIHIHVCVLMCSFLQWHLVCDLRSLKQMGQTVYMGGVLVGALVFGGLSDR